MRMLIKRLSRPGWALLLALLLVLPQLSSAGLRVFACEPEWGALVRELAPAAEVYVATHAAQNPHYVEARPSLISQLRRADLAVCSGADLEVGWLPAVVQRAANAQVRPGAPGFFLAAEQVSRLQQVHRHGDRRDGDIHPGGNPHVQLDPRRLIDIADALAARMAELDPSGAMDYRRRSIQFQARWNRLISAWEARAAPLRGETLVVQHSSFDYLLNWLGMTTVADLEPNPGLPPTSGHLQQVLDNLEDAEPLGILITGYQNPRPANWLAARTDLPVLQLPTTVTGAPPTDELAGLFEYLIERLLAARDERGEQRALPQAEIEHG